MWGEFMQMLRAHHGYHPHRAAFIAKNSGCTTSYGRSCGDQSHGQRCCGGTPRNTVERQHSRGWERQPQLSSCGGGGAGMRRRCSEYILRHCRATRSANRGPSRSPESVRKGNRPGGLSREPCIGCGCRGCAENSHGLAPYRHQRRGRVLQDLLGRNEPRRPVGGRDAEHADKSGGKGCWREVQELARRIVAVPGIKRGRHDMVCGAVHDLFYSLQQVWGGTRSVRVFLEVLRDVAKSGILA